MMKRIISVIALLLITVFSVNADGFQKVHNYENGLFSDVAENAWYFNDVRNSYEFGLVNGVGGDKFDPQGTVTVAQAVTLAARFFESYSGQQMGGYDDVSNWYDPYVMYSIENGIINEGQFDSYDRVAKRHEVATLFAASLPEDYFKPLNSVFEIPDVSADKSYYNSLILLYKSGIAMGSDAKGTFNPDANITRAEFAALISRVASPGSRLAKSFDTMPEDDAYFMVDAPVMVSPDTTFTLPSGWLVDNKNAETVTDGKLLAKIIDDSKEEYTALYRDFDVINSGRIILDVICDIASADDGIYIGFADDKRQPVLKLSTDDGFFKLSGKNELVTDIIVPKEYPEEFSVVLNVDLDNSLMYAIINGKITDSVEISKGVALSRIDMGSTKAGTGIFVPSIVRMYHNYALAENFMSSSSMLGSEPYSFNVSGNITLETYFSGKDDTTSVKIDANAGSENIASRSFAKVAGKGIFEAYVLLPDGNDGAFFTITCANSDAVKIESRNGAWYSGDAKLRDFTKNVWQILRIETDTDTDKAVVKICGKKVGDIPLTADYIDGIKIGFNSKNDAVMWFDDVTAKPVVDHEDYPSAPASNNDDDYNVGIHVCNLWHDTTTYEGWQSVAPFAELEPWLGYYDEGSSELADWEIKIMAEHGIDFQHFCWYSPTYLPSAPIKKPIYSDAAINNGYFNAKYSDAVKFCIMWENNHAYIKSSLETFREYLWNYWKEYYFTDSRYMVIDNKPIFSIWVFDYFLEFFGGVDEAKAAVEFMRNDIKTLGFDDLIIIVPEQESEKVKAVGLDGMFYYHYYKEGGNADYQIETLRSDVGRDMYVIPTLAIGHNDIGRNDTRSSLVSLDGHKKVAQYIKNDYLDNVNTGTWKDNLLFVSNWNEYSEGHYVSPSGEFGYGYLENVKDVFTGDTTDHSKLDVKPTDAQKQRITKMFPDTHQPIRILRLEDPLDGVKMKPVISWDFSKDETYNTWKLISIEKDNVTENGLTAHGTSTDPVIQATGLNIDLTLKPVIHIRLKAEKTTIMSLFFATETSTNIEGHIKHKDVIIEKTGEFVDYYIDMKDISEWKGTLKKLRVDPVSDTNTFEISLIELVLPDVEQAAVYANGVRMSFDFIAEIKNGDVEVTANPRLGFFTMQNLFHTWNRFTGKLYVESKNHALEMTVGSDKAILDGKTVDLGYTFATRDGLPVIRIVKFNQLLGNAAEIKDGVVNIISCVSEQKEAQTGYFGWEFDDASDIVGWSGSNANLNAFGGHMLISNVHGTDMQIHAPTDTTLDASHYSKLVVGLSGNPEKAEGKVFQLYFAAPGEGHSELKLFTHDYDASVMKKDETYVIEIDLSTNDYWKGKVTKFRFDVFNEETNCKIDYIRFIEGENKASTNESEAKRPEHIPENAVVYEDYELLNEGNTGGNPVSVLYSAEGGKGAVFDWATIASYNGSKAWKKSDGYMCLGTGMNLTEGNYTVMFDVNVENGSEITLSGGIIGSETVRGSARVSRIVEVKEGEEPIKTVDFRFTPTVVYFDNFVIVRNDAGSVTDNNTSENEKTQVDSAQDDYTDGAPSMIIPDNAILYEDYESLNEGNTGGQPVRFSYAVNAAQNAFFDWAVIENYNGSKMWKKSDGYMCLATGLELAAGRYTVSFDVYVADGSQTTLSGGVIGNETVSGYKRVVKMFDVGAGETVATIDFNFTSGVLYFDNVVLERVS